MNSKKAEETNGVSSSTHSGRKNSKKEEDRIFKGILKKIFKVFRVSPMFNFSWDKLQFYQNILNEHLNSTKEQNSDVYKCKFILNSNLKFDRQSSGALQVEIIKNDSKSVYEGHFISWTNERWEMEGSVSLPILLVKGDPREFNSANSIICKIFDCDIQPLTFSFHAMITFFVKLLEAPRNSIDTTEEQVTLEYKIPGCQANDRIMLSLSIETTTIVFAVTMDSLREKFQGITNNEIILQFYGKILNHAYKIYEMDFAHAELHKVSFPDAFLTNDGEVRITTPDAALVTLEVLSHFVPIDAILRL